MWHCNKKDTRSIGRACVICKRRNGHLIYHRFPKDPIRCAQWRIIAGDTQLLHKTTDQLNKSYRICSLHFSASQHFSCTSKLLSSSAYPDTNLPEPIKTEEAAAILTQKDTGIDLPSDSKSIDRYEYGFTELCSGVDTNFGAIGMSAAVQSSLLLEPSANDSPSPDITFAADSVQADEDASPCPDSPSPDIKFAAYPLQADEDASPCPDSPSPNDTFDAESLYVDKDTLPCSDSSSPDDTLDADALQADKDMSPCRCDRPISNEDLMSPTVEYQISSQVDAKMEITTLETNQGKKCILYNGYRYRVNCYLKAGGISWRCSNARCPATVQTNSICCIILQEKNSHNHDQSNRVNDRHLVRSRAKRKAAEDILSHPSKIISKELQYVSEENLIPADYKSLAKAVYRARKKKQKQQHLRVSKEVENMPFEVESNWKDDLDNLENTTESVETSDRPPLNEELMSTAVDCQIKTELDTRMKITTLETSHGKKCILYNGYRYRIDSYLKSGDISWRCSNAICPATVHTNSICSMILQEKNNHNHNLSNRINDRHLIRSRAKCKAAVDIASHPSKIISNELQYVSEENLIPADYKNLAQAIYRSRKKKQQYLPQISKEVKDMPFEVEELNWKGDELSNLENTTESVGTSDRPTSNEDLLSPAKECRINSQVDAKMEITTLETNQGKKCILYNGYRYRVNSYLKSGDISWRCSNGMCPATVQTNNKCSLVLQERHSHNHDQNNRINNRHLIRSRAKRKATEDILSPPSKILRGELQYIAEKNLIPADFKSIAKAVYRARKKKQQQPLPQVSKEVEESNRNGDEVNKFEDTTENIRKGDKPTSSEDLMSPAKEYQINSQVDAEMEITTLETNQGKKCILYNGYRYRVNSYLKSGDISWRCSNGMCPATVQTNNKCSKVLQEKHSHNHDQNNRVNNRHLIRSRAKRKATEDILSPPSKILRGELQYVAEENLIPADYKSIAKAVYRARKKKKKQQPLPQVSKEADESSRNRDEVNKLEDTTENIRKGDRPLLNEDLMSLAVDYQISMQVDAKIEITTLETKHGKKCILYNGYRYRIDSYLKSGDISWRCSNARCPATVHTNNTCSMILQEKNSHYHDQMQHDLAREKQLQT